MKKIILLIFILLFISGCGFDNNLAGNFYEDSGNLYYEKVTDRSSGYFVFYEIYKHHDITYFNGADLNTFRLSSDQSILNETGGYLTSLSKQMIKILAEDKNYYYLRESVIPKKEVSKVNNYLTKDDNYLFCDNGIINYTAPQMLYMKGENKKILFYRNYYNNKFLQNPINIQRLNNNFAKNNQFVFYKCDIIEDAYPQNFKVFSDNIGVSGDFIYYFVESEYIDYKYIVNLKKIKLSNDSNLILKELNKFGINESDLPKELIEEILVS